MTSRPAAVLSIARALFERDVAYETRVFGAGLAMLARRPQTWDEASPQEQERCLDEASAMLLSAGLLTAAKPENIDMAFKQALLGLK